MKCHGTEYESNDMGYHSRSDAHPEGHLSTAAAEPSWEPPSGDQPPARNHVAFYDNSIYGSRPAPINDVNIGHSSHEFYKEHCEMVCFSMKAV